jgi:hypothetical protein
MIIKYLGLSIFLALSSFNLAAQQSNIKPIKISWDFFKNTLTQNEMRNKQLSFVLTFSNKYV